MKLFSSAHLQRRGALDDEIGGDGDNAAPAFVEIAPVRSGSSRGDDPSDASATSRISRTSRASSYRPPEAIPENESEVS